MADREERSAPRPLRPAVPPVAETRSGWIPRPRRFWGTPAVPDRPASADNPAIAADKPVTADGPATTDTDKPVTADGPATTDSPTAVGAPTTVGSAPPLADRSEPVPAAEVDQGRPDPAPSSTGVEPTKGDADPAKGSAEPTKGDADPAKGSAEPANGSGTSAKDGADPTGTGEGDGKATDSAAEAEPAAAEPEGARRRRRYRTPFGRRLRMPPPRQAALATIRATRAWSRRPSGRLTLPGLFLLALVAVTATAGALLVPATARAPRPAAVDASASPGPTDLPGGGQLPPGGTGPPVSPGGPGLPGAPPVFPGTGRPADALADWAQRTGQRTSIAPVAMQAYGYAELVLAQSNPSCGLSWTTLAAIGYVESRHGQANGATLQPTGLALPEIIGDPLDGQGGRQRIMDTDGGQLDRDRTYDRAVGPMQFIPTTWQEIGADADGDGVKNPHDLDDAALAAGNYLCKGGRNLSIAGDWWGAILSYNDVRRYAQEVHDTANRYGLASRT